MVDRIYPTELQLNRANSSDTEAPFLDLNLCISNDTVSTKIYDKRDDFDFDIVNFPFLDGDVPRRTSYGVNISHLIRFARASSNLNDFNYRNKALTAKLLRQGYRYFKLSKALSKFFRRHSALLEKYSVSLKTPLHMTSFSLRKKVAKNSCSTDNSTRCFMATALNSPTLLSLFTRGGITRFTWGNTFLC